MNIEYDTKVLVINADLQSAIDLMTREGWQQVPNVNSVAIFNVMRIKESASEPQGMGGFGVLHIDESKIQIIRNGKLVED